MAVLNNEIIVPGPEVYGRQVIYIRCSCYNGLAAKKAGNLFCNIISAANMPANKADCKFTLFIKYDNRRVCLFVFYQGSNSPYNYSGGHNEDQGAVFLPQSRQCPGLEFKDPGVRIKPCKPLRKRKAVIGYIKNRGFFSLVH